MALYPNVSMSVLVINAFALSHLILAIGCEKCPSIFENASMRYFGVSLRTFNKYTNRILVCSLVIVRKYWCHGLVCERGQRCSCGDFWKCPTEHPWQCIGGYVLRKVGGNPNSYGNLTIVLIISGAVWFRRRCQLYV